MKGNLPYKSLSLQKFKVFISEIQATNIWQQPFFQIMK